MRHPIHGPRRSAALALLALVSCTGEAAETGRGDPCAWSEACPGGVDVTAGEERSLPAPAALPGVPVAVAWQPAVPLGLVHAAWVGDLDGDGVDDGVLAAEDGDRGGWLQVVPGLR